MITVKPDLTKEQLNTLKTLCETFSLSELVCEILIKRGIDSVEKCKKFIFSGKENFLSPYQLTNLEKAEKRVRQAIQKGERILIYGDYDCDGVCATSVLYYCFKEMGVKVDTYVPERSNGYGITSSSIEEILPFKPELIITVDCGISCREEIAFLKSKNIDVVVTDHHELPEVLPDTITVNCKIKGDYPYDNLCGCATAYKLARVLIGEKADELLDFVAVATIADSMTLDCENRDLVAEGLKLFSSPRPCFKALLEISNVKEINATSLAFSLAPRINASGRMNKAKEALELLKCEDYSKCVTLAEKVNSYNALRQTECEKVYLQAKEQLEKEGMERSSIVLQDERWSGGLTGIVASRLVEEYSRPVILFSVQGDFFKGSARSVEGINIFDALKKVSDYVSGFGGHSQAAGVTVQKDKFEDFKAALDKVISCSDSECFVKKTVVDKMITRPLKKEEVKDLSKFEPCGTGNKKPLFATQASFLSVKQLSGKHIAFSATPCEMVYFNGQKYMDDLSDGFGKKIVFEPSISSYNGWERVKGYVKRFEKDVCGEKENLYFFKNYLRNLKKQGELAKKVTFEEMGELIKISLKKPYGTLFVLSDNKNIKRYPMLEKMSFCAQNVDDDSLINKVGYALSSYGNYKNVLCLDSGVALSENAVVTSDVPAFDVKLSCDRADFIPIFNLFKLKCYVDSVDFALKNDFDKYQAIFVIEVFIELGLIKEFGEYICVDKTKKSSLEDSVIYNRVKTEK